MANENRYYLTPFAESGNRTEVPNSSIGGFVGYDTGFGPDYELPQESANRKRIERDKYNAVLFGVTKNLKQWQEELYPTWIQDDGTGAAFSYPKGMIVIHQSQTWSSNEDANQDEPAIGSKWSVFDILQHDLLTKESRNAIGSHDAIYRRSTTVAEIESGVFTDIPSYFSLSDRGGAKFDLVIGGAADGYGVINAGNGNTAVYSNETENVNPKAFGVVYDGNFRNPVDGKYYQDAAFTIPSTNNQLAMQAAWDYAYFNNGNIRDSIGTAVVNTIITPPVGVTEPRGDAFTVSGAGGGNAFVGSYPLPLCTKYVSERGLNAPVIHLQDRRGIVNTGGQVTIRNIRLEADSEPAEVMLCDQLGEYSRLDGIEMIQFGEGDGLVINYFMKANIERCNILNKDAFLTPTGNELRFGAAVRIKAGDGGGIPTIKKITGRGFKTAYILGEGATRQDNMSGLKLEQCESSVVRVGIDIREFTLAPTLDTCYFEGISETHIIDRGTASDIHSGIHFVNAVSQQPVTFIDSLGGTTGNSYHHNYIETSRDGDTLIDINGSEGKHCGFNTLIYGGTTQTNVTGINISGVFPKIFGVGNNIFNPKGGWLGVGTEKIKKSYTGIMTGENEAQNGDDLSCPLLLGAINYTTGQAILTEANVVGNELTIPDGVNVFTLAPSVPVSINSIVASSDGIRPLWLNLTNDNTTFTNSSLVRLDGGSSISGEGSVLFHLTTTGITNFTFEVTRASYV